MNMPDCICLPRCPFFNDRMGALPEKAEEMKDKYCRGDNSRCARHMVFDKLGREKVPPDLYPIQMARAKQIIDSA